MRPSPLLILIVTLVAATASAQDDAPSLDGVGRISIQGGWKLVSNSTFYDHYYSLPGNAGLERAGKSPGGPLAVGTFAYGISDLVELGIDLFAQGERLQLTNKPRLTTVGYGALVGLRFRGWLNIGPEGTVPYLGILTGPLLATSLFEGGTARETLSQAWAGTAGATLRLNATWGISLEYRLVFARGAVGQASENLGSFNAGGNWFSVGVNYTFPKDPGPASKIGF
ncbi:hypothetical protein [Hyalangium versicolor]|uniref:hypothetical protein n=1 Tax=Hyalangium versicolor TaxID=2861190 RepID=UPI001CCDF27F|nr:hypothetical protein [Hyalangium versicolor]